MDFKKLITACIFYMQTEYPNRTKNYDKCKRDLGYILDAIVKDVEHNTDTFTRRIANRFWYDGERQIVSYDAEIAVYKFLLEKLKNVLSEDKFSKAEHAINTLCRIVEQGPELTDTGTNLVQDVVKAEHCQRNWDHSYIVPEADLDAMIKVATTMPAKQNRNYYDLIVSTDLDFNNKIYSLAADPDNPDTPLRNSQVNANALFIYAWNYDFENDNNVFKDNHAHNTAIAVGISSGALTLAAAQMDYRTGFCQCFLMKEVVKELRSNGIDIPENAKIELMVGVGKPNTNYKWTEVLDETDSSVKTDLHSYIKKVKVERI
jgi:nitroreductase